jgi:twitching motility protein PilT
MSRKMIEALLSEVIKSQGSDLHLEQGQRPKMRVNGSLRDLTEYPVFYEDEMKEMMRSITDESTWQKFEESGDVDFAYALREEARFRSNYFRHFYGYGAVFRMIPSQMKTLDDLGVPEIVKSFSDFRSGLVLVTGPTGSGKSSTMAAIINDINQKYAKKIVTIEEPVEFLHKNMKSIIVHREVGLDTKTFGDGLRTGLKSDTNIILVGELRDKETIELALHAAEMGILVFGTLHTNSAAKTIDRIIDVFPPKQKNQIREVLANTVRAVVSQQLVRSKEGNRRWVACEILLRTTALAPMIRSGETSRITGEIEVNRALGMISMDAALRKLVNEGKITNQEASLKAISKSLFKENSSSKDTPTEASF